MQKLKQGFTLVELIVVITIVAILGAISFIAFQGYTKTEEDRTIKLTTNYMDNNAGGLYTMEGVSNGGGQTGGGGTGWRALDQNCSEDDISFDTDNDGIIDQIWAGCNSTLGSGFEWGRRYMIRCIYRKLL